MTWTHVSCVTGHLRAESISGRWIPLTNGQQCGALVWFLLPTGTSDWSKYSSNRWFGIQWRSYVTKVDCLEQDHGFSFVAYIRIHATTWNSVHLILRLCACMYVFIPSYNSRNIVCCKSFVILKGLLQIGVCLVYRGPWRECKGSI